MCDMDLPNNNYSVVGEAPSHLTSEEKLKKGEDLGNTLVDITDCIIAASSKKKEKDENINPVYTTETID